MFFLTASVRELFSYLQPLPLPSRASDPSGPHCHHSEGDEVDRVGESLRLIPTERSCSQPGAQPGINSGAYFVVVVVAVFISLS